MGIGEQFELEKTGRIEPEKHGRFIRRASIKSFEEMGYFIFCPLDGSDAMLNWKMCQARQDKGRCPGEGNKHSRSVKLCPYRKDE